MNYTFGLSKKAAIGAAAIFMMNFAEAQTLADGINYQDSHKFAKAKEAFTSMIASSATAPNYFYLGNAYLTQFEPNFDKAKEQFDKGLSVDSKSYLNKVGLASIKLGKGDKNGAINDFANIAKDSREKDPEVLYRIGEALTIYDNSNSPTLAIDYMNKAIEKAEKNGVPAYYYYTLGDAYRMIKDAGNAMTAYDKASVVAKSKASVFTRMATLWMAAKQYKLADENIKKAISVDATYAPAYKAQAAYNFVFQNQPETTKSLLKYTQYADEDPSTILEISKLYFINGDYAQAKSTLDKVFDKVSDPIKYKLKAYLNYQDGNYTDAKTNLDMYFAKTEKSRIIPSDSGLQGLIIAGLAIAQTDSTLKTSMRAEAEAKVLVAKNAKDETFNWDKELMKLRSGGSISQKDVDAGPTNESIENLKKQVAANKEDTTALFNLGNAYQDAKNWFGAAQTWEKMNELLPTWEPAFYSKAYALQNAGKSEMAVEAYENFLKVIATKTPDEQDKAKEMRSGAYYSIAYLLQKTDVAKAKQMLDQALLINPTDSNSLGLKKILK